MGTVKIDGVHRQVDEEPVYFGDCDIGENGRKKLTDFLRKVELHNWWTRQKARQARRCQTKMR